MKKKIHSVTSPPVSFYVEEVTHVPMEPTLIKKVWRNRSFSRIESNIPNPLTGSITICRPDLRVVWNVDPVEKTYTQVSLPKSWTGQALDLSQIAGTECEPDSHETIDGLKCAKLVMRLKKTGQPFAVRYINPKTGLVRRELTFDKSGATASSTEFVNLNIGPLPSELFEIPDGYVRISITSRRPLPKKKAPRSKQTPISPKRG